MVRFYTSPARAAVRELPARAKGGPVWPGKRTRCRTPTRRSAARASRTLAGLGSRPPPWPSPPGAAGQRMMRGRRLGSFFPGRFLSRHESVVLLALYRPGRELGREPDLAEEPQPRRPGEQPLAVDVVGRDHRAAGLPQQESVLRLEH